MSRALPVLAAALAPGLALPAPAQEAPGGGPAPAQLAQSVSLDLRRLGYDVAPEDLTRRQAVQLQFALDDGPAFGGIEALRFRQRIETILASPDGAGTVF